MTPWLDNASATKEVLSRFGIRTRKRFGQNFLIDGRVLDKIIDAASVTKEDFCLEIGPGIGTLTQHLAANAKQVLAVEIDKDLIPVLDYTLAGFDNVTVLQNDILKTDIAEISKQYNGGKPIKIVANLPYYITTPIIMGIIESGAPVDTQTFMIQKEVAQRMVASPGGKDYGALTLAVSYHCTAKINADVPPNCFIPRPDVTSSVITLKKREEKIPVKNEKTMFTLIRAAFSTRRKTLVNCLSACPDLNLGKEDVKKLLTTAGFNENIRGEQLSLEQFALLSDLL